MNELLTPVLAQTVFGITFDYTLRNVVMGSAILGIVGGMVGTMAVLRRQSLLSDTLAHAALPGICLAFILTGTKSSFGFIVGAAITGWIGTMVLLAIVRGSRIKEDAALGIVLSVFFGFGTVLLTQISRSGQGDVAGLNRFLFGQAASIIEGDVITMALFGAAALAVVALLFKEFMLITFDPAFAASIGYRVTPLTIILTSLIVIAVVIGLQAVGVILMVTVLVAPALAARQWTNRFGRMMLLAAAFGGVSGVIGSVISAQISGLPTGPTIVLVSTVFVILSIGFAPERGLIWAMVEQLRLRDRVSRTVILGRLAERDTAEAPLTAPALAAASGRSRQAVSATLRGLARSGLVRKTGTTWAMTAAGATAAEDAARRERLWRSALANQMALPLDSVHLTIDEIERVLGPETINWLEQQEDASVATTTGQTSGHRAMPQGAD